jgi:hypothetical protein
MNSFDQTSDIGNLVVLEVRPLLELISFNGRYVRTDKGPLSRSLQERIGDVLYNSDDTEVWSVEIKGEREHTGNLFIETWSNRSRFNRGWLDKLDADLLLYYFLDTKDLYAIRLQKLRAWAFGGSWGAAEYPHGNIYRFREVKQRRWEQLNDTWGRLVPIETVRVELGFRHLRGPEFVEVEYEIPQALQLAMPDW